MAGIGFELRRMIDARQGLVARIRGYASAGLISSGPWLVTIFTLGILSAFAPHFASRQEFDLFRGLVTYAFAFSLIVLGVLQMTVTRKVADWLYTKSYKRVLPAFNACVLVVAVVQIVIGAAFCAIARLPTGLSFAAVSLYVTVSLTWLSLIWLGITREFDVVLKGYGSGALVVFLLVGVFPKPVDATGLLGSYALGQAIILVYLWRAIVRGLRGDGERSFAVLRSVPEFPRLMAVGLAYNAAIWIDKIIFWIVDGIGPHPMIHFHPLYDTCCFLAYMTVIPALAVNLVRVETGFYECYRSYFGAILGGRPLKVIERRRHAMFDNLKEGMNHLLRIQGAVTVLVLVFAPYLIDAVGMPPASVRVFRAVTVGAFFHVMLLVTVLMQLYFDLRWQALWTSLLFLVLNTVLALVSLDAGLWTYGFGYPAAALVALLTGYALLAKSSQHLDYYVFTSQPIAADAPETDRD